MRGEFAAIGSAFDMLPQIQTTGVYSTTFNQVGNFIYTLPSASGTLATTANVATETARAIAAEGVLTTAISTETTARITETTRATTAEGLLAPKASPALTGIPTAPTATVGTNTTQLATTAFVSGSVAAATTGVSSVAGRTGAVTLTNADVSGSAPLASPAFTGVPAAPTATALTSTTQLATTAFTTAAVAVETSRATTAEALLAPKASPTFTGTVTIPGGASISGFAPLASPAFTGTPSLPTGATAVTQASGDNDTSVATTAFVTAAVLPALNNVGRNLIHNSMFRVQQRGGGAFAATGYTIDRWVLGITTDTSNMSAAALGDTQRASIGDEAAAVCAAVNVTGNAAAGASTVIDQRIEDVRRLAGKTVTVSFYAASNSLTPKIGVSIDQYFGTGGSPSARVNGAGQAVVISVAWTRYSLTFAVPSIIGKTVGTNGDHYTDLNFWFSSGATNNTRAGSIGVQTCSPNIWGVQLEVGTVATPLEKPDYALELANCQRFCFISAQYVPPLTDASGVTIIYPVTMRAVPTISGGGAGFTASAPASTAAGCNIGQTTGAVATLTFTADL